MLCTEICINFQSPSCFIRKFEPIVRWDKCYVINTNLMALDIAKKRFHFPFRKMMIFSRKWFLDYEIYTSSCDTSEKKNNFQFFMCDLSIEYFFVWLICDPMVIIMIYSLNKLRICALSNESSHTVFNCFAILSWIQYGGIGCVYVFGIYFQSNLFHFPIVKRDINWRWTHEKRFCLYNESVFDVYTNDEFSIKRKFLSFFFLCCFFISQQNFAQKEFHTHKPKFKWNLKFE